MRIAIIILAAALLAGCFPATKEELKRDGQVERFQVEDNYQAVYRRLAPTMRRCFESVWIGDRVVVRSELYTDLRRAELVVEGLNALPPTNRVMLMLELEALGDKLTEVSVTVPPVWSGRPLDPIYARWARGETSDCP